MNRILLSLLFLTSFLCVKDEATAQSKRNTQLNNSHFLKYSKSLDSVRHKVHSSVKPLRLEELRNPESPVYLKSRGIGEKGWIGKKLYREHLIVSKESDHFISVDPLFNFNFGSSDGSKTWINTRGALIEGDLGGKVSFSSRFYENQGKYPEFIDTFIRANRVLPGQARVRPFGDGYDFGWASGYLSFSPSKHFNLQLGHGKHFIGDGYRSLLLSDHSHAYPFIKITTDVGIVKYQNIFTEFQDFRTSNLNVDSAYVKKRAHIHYLDLALGRRWNIGLFEAVVWRDEDAFGRRGFDFNYWNPIIFLRPVEYSIGSPDNVLMGANFRFRVNHFSSIYLQFIIDELKVSEVLSNSGWWGNKQGMQIGFKNRALFGIENLNLQMEYNVVRPYTYSQRSSRQSYVHNNLALAHPLGANFSEGVGVLSYNFKRFEINSKTVLSSFGEDMDSLNYGKNIDVSFWANRPMEFNNKVGQGLKTSLFQHNTSIAYLLNPKTNMRIELSFLYRSIKNDLGEDNTVFISFGFSTSLENFYYDFK